ncbi:hypothetical protein [Aeromicrobium ginsengisoli]|uniref:Uncharacterized protein n=1 Tax=Aeromicrobium ginsengisoli TaxID=363867 RepID=A0A5M4FH88_9ACTN|nr:hypothetical protein [Aeromicrobium ginsengisoli]KAA1399546.1 hypothetical protein ESP70_001925 [Aeromicrobium ginsengisoli]
MSDEQQFAAAGDLLRAHLKRNGGDERPSLASIQDFAAVLGQGCANHSTSTVAEIGNGIALPD